MGSWLRLDAISRSAWARLRRAAREKWRGRPRLPVAAGLPAATIAGVNVKVVPDTLGEKFVPPGKPASTRWAVPVPGIETTDATAVALCVTLLRKMLAVPGP